MGSVICHIPSNGNSRVTFLLSIRCVQFGTRPIQRFYERRKFGFDPLSSNVNLTLEVGNHTQCSSSRPTLNCNQNDYGWRKRTVERDVVCYSLRGITEICHLLRGVSYWNPLKSRSTASYRQSDRSWNRIKANSGHFVPCWVRSILSELQGSRSDQLPFGGRKFSYETVSTTYTAIRRIVDNSSHSIRSTLFNRVNPDRVTLCGTHPPGRRLLSF